ncbi:MocR-like pyridoxine biosynthesis transcription factor PdxR [Kitasatospora paracochleata]|uniref:GntR family transcriptional regulator/MocR family aminotransferase n=1 Tax=Kitasatospora paracochleata TaxID=58354 RepID=A0ABT1ITY2_9ACTN|nr:PLP-dependent aminotransferase family protein [Kitasatospora paracochleata]MCP2308597.1 GntR family transcriptional regulator/MocR family aminotransferase [Kitasatospora paracochleata]
MPKNWSGHGVDLHLEPAAAAGGRRVGLEGALREAIRAGRLAAGTSLPGTRALAAELGLARGTVTAAYDQLVEEGYLTARPGSGTSVAALPASDTVAAARPAAAPAEPVHDLRPGRPDLDAFPVRTWLAATRRVLGRVGPQAFGPGDPQGRIELRTALAEHLARTRGVVATPDRVVVTAGFHQAMALLGGVLAAGGTTRVAAEDPGHDVYRALLGRAGLAVDPLPVDREGARVEELGPDVGAVSLTPSHQYPTGVPLHPRRRRALRAWAHTTGGLVLEDDYDGEFRYDRQPVGALQGTAPDRVVYCGTASKTLAPALRLAWLVLPPELVDPVVRARERTDLYGESLGQLILADLIAGHAYERHVRAARLRYRRRRGQLVERIGALPGPTVHGVAAGLHTLVTLPDHGPGEAPLLARCAERGVALRGLSELHHDPTGRPEGLLIGFGAPAERAWPAALDALSAVLAEQFGR